MSSGYTCFGDARKRAGTLIHVCLTRMPRWEKALACNLYGLLEKTSLK